MTMSTEVFSVNLAKVSGDADLLDDLALALSETPTTSIRGRTTGAEGAVDLDIVGISVVRV
jgi:hypothetical protein